MYSSPTYVFLSVDFFCLVNCDCFQTFNTNSQKRETLLLSYRRVIRPEKGPISLFNRYNVSNKPILPAVQKQFIHFLNFSGLKQPYAKQCAQVKLPRVGKILLFIFLRIVHRAYRQLNS